MKPLRIFLMAALFLVVFGSDGGDAGWSMDTDLSSADASFWGDDYDDRSGRHRAAQTILNHYVLRE